MKKYLLFLFILTLFSCNRQSDFEKKLIEGEWVFHPVHDGIADLKDYEYVKFYDNGTYERYPYYDKSLKAIDEGVEQEKWEYIPETKRLNFLGESYEILSADEKIIRLSKGNVEYTLSNDQGQTKKD